METGIPGDGAVKTGIKNFNLLKNFRKSVDKFTGNLYDREQEITEKGNDGEE